MKVILVLRFFINVICEQVSIVPLKMLGNLITFFHEEICSIRQLSTVYALPLKNMNLKIMLRNR